jgi:hypothetical protein
MLYICTTSLTKRKEDGQKTGPEKIKEKCNSYSQPLETHSNSVQQHQQCNLFTRRRKVHLLLQDACPNNGQNNEERAFRAVVRRE